MNDVEGDSPERKEFLEVIQDIERFAGKADRTLDKLIHSDANWLMSTFMKMM